MPVDPAPLTYNVAQLLGEPVGSTRHYDVSGVTIPLPEPLRLADPVEGRVDLARTNRGLLVRARLTTSLEGECSRCLRPVESPVEIQVEEEALPSIHPETGQPVETDEPDLLRLTDHHELELEPVVADAISLAEPIAPLCEPDCPGLCVVCGERLDGGGHDHGPADIDPRLEALLAFRPVDEDDTGDADADPEDAAEDRSARDAAEPVPGPPAGGPVEVDGDRQTR